MKRNQDLCGLRKRFRGLIDRKDVGKKSSLSGKNGLRKSGSSRGALWVEAAFLLPIMVGVAVGTAEIGNVYLQRTNVANMAHSIAMAIQQNPEISAEQLYTFQKNLVGGILVMREVKRQDQTPYTDESNPCSVADCQIAGLEIKALADKGPVARGAIKNAISASNDSDWSSPFVTKIKGDKNTVWPHASSPWKIDPEQDVNDDGSPYYIGVEVAWTAKPMFSMLKSASMFADGGVKQFASAVIRPQPVTRAGVGDPTLNEECPPAGTLCGSAQVDWVPYWGPWPHIYTTTPIGGLASPSGLHSGFVIERGVGAKYGERTCQGIDLIDATSLKNFSSVWDSTTMNAELGASAPEILVNCPAGYKGVVTANFMDTWTRVYTFSCASKGSGCKGSASGLTESLASR